MGIEQGKPASGSIIELPPIADLPDPRLPRAFKTWRSFTLTHQSQMSRMNFLSTEEVVALAAGFSVAISQDIGISMEYPLSAVSVKKIFQLTQAINRVGSKVVFMRHGEQSPPEWIFSIKDPALRKIRMMQDPVNGQDLLTNHGLVDVFMTAFTLSYIQRATAARVYIITSENLRAKEAAYIFSMMMDGVTLATQEGLNCVTYRDEIDDPPLAAEQLLEELPSGTMPLDPKLIDKLCKKTRSGLSCSEAITVAVGDLIKESKGGGNNLFLVLTHTQQLAEVLRLNNILEDPAIRFPELTMLVLTEGSLQAFPRGVLVESLEERCG